MVIRKMNSMFTKHGRWMFAVITVVIIISFVGFFTPGFTSLFAPGGGASTPVGEVFGEKVTYEDVRIQSRLDAIYIGLARNMDINNQQLLEYASQMAFASIAQLKAAKKRGIVVSDKEVADFLASLPSVQKDGAFSMDKYKELLKELREKGVDDEMLEKSIRGALIREKLSAQLRGQILITPDEIRLYCNDINGRYSVIAANFTAEKFEKKALESLGAEDVENYFKANRVKYMVPEQYKIRLVEFKYTDFIKDAAKDVDDVQIEAYYNANKNEFTVTAEDKTTVTPLKDVKAKISAKLNMRNAGAIARKQALVFAHEAYRRISNVASPEKIVAEFIEEASKNNKDVKNIGLVSIDKPSVEPEIFAQLPKISRYIPVSNPIPGQNATWVVLLEDKIEAAQAELDAVKDQVKKDLVGSKAIALARDAAREAVLFVTEAKPADKVAALDRLAKISEISRPEEFSVMAPPQGENGRLIAHLATSTEIGAVSAVEDTRSGALFIFVQNKKLPDEKDFEKMKAQITYFYTMMKENAIDANFNAWLQSNIVEYQQQRGN